MTFLFYQSRTEEEEAKIRELEKNLRKEKERSDKLETDYLTLKVKNQHTVKFLNFRMPKNFAVIYLKFKERGQTLGYFVIKMTVE